MSERLTPHVEAFTFDEVKDRIVELKNRWGRLNERFTAVVKVIRGEFHERMKYEGLNNDEIKRIIKGGEETAAERRGWRKALSAESHFNFPEVAKIHGEFLKLESDIYTNAEELDDKRARELQAELTHFENIIERFEEQIQKNEQK